MTKTELERTSNLLKGAAEVAEGNMRERLYEQSDQLATPTARRRELDHRRFVRHIMVLHDLIEDLDDDAAETVCEARNEVLEYRKDVPGI